MKKLGLSKGLLRRLEKMEAASKVEQFDSIGIVCIGMAVAEDIPVKELENKSNLTLIEILEEENRVLALGEIPAVETKPGADLDTLAMEMENPQPIAVQVKVEETGKSVLDWYVEADGSVSNLVNRITSEPTDWGRNYRRDDMGVFSEDLGLERKSTKPGRGAIIWLATKPGTKPFPTKIGTRAIRYA
jgi:hypothetical protein